jgi:hypothetical protein
MSNLGFESLSRSYGTAQSTGGLVFLGPVAVAPGPARRHSEYIATVTAESQRRNHPIVIRAHEDVADQIRRAAAAEHRSVSNFGAVHLGDAAERVLAGHSPGKADEEPSR